ncbi:MAG TPA: PKD domain-containing protein [Thermoanaerobaculia bacterium]|nr:PKD domain-containing protein [Thermoanaerobaculia bacterium]
MKKILLTATILLCFAASLEGQGFLYPTGPAGGPPQSCPGCPPPRTSVTEPLGQVYPYDDPIVGFHRYLDSVWVGDWQQPFRTARAWKAVVAPDRNRVYMRIGSQLNGYDIDSFLNRLVNRDQLIAGGTRYDGVDYFLRPDKYFYAESGGWFTPTTDGQERLYGFDWDDRKLVYLAYTHFGWGIVQDDLANDRQPMDSLSQVYGESAPDNIFVLKTNSGKYYAYIGEAGARQMQVYDVTNAASPVRVSDLDWQPRPSQYAKLGNYFAVLGSGGKLDIYTQDGFIARQPPLKSVSAPGFFWSVAAGEIKNGVPHFYATADAGGQKLGILTITVNQNVVSDTISVHGVFYGLMVEHHLGYLTVAGTNDVKLFNVAGGTPQEIDLHGWVDKYYSNPPSPNVKPNRALLRHATPLKAGTKIYIVLSVYSLGDVIEVRSEDAISAEVVDRPTGEIFFGDRVGFVAKTSASTPKTVLWNFDNSEGFDTNAGESQTGQAVYHTYSGLTGSSAVQKTVTASSSPAAASVSLTLKPPTARFKIFSTNYLFTLADASSAAPIVFGDLFADASDGDLSGHYTDWAIGGTTTSKAPNETMLVGDCGTHSLTFTTHYGLVSGPPYTAQGAFTRTITPFNYAVRPFVAVVGEPAAAGTALRFTSASRFSAGLGLAASNVVHQWDLIGANDQLILAGSSASSWDVPQASIVHGSRVRLKLSTTATLPGACAGLTESVAYSEPLNPPDPVITGGCTNGAPPCNFAVGSTTGQSMSGWSYQWSATGPGLVTPSSATTPTYSPTFGSVGSYTVTVTATNPIGSVAVSKVEQVTTAGTNCEPMSAGNVFPTYTGPSSGCRPGLGSCSTSETINFTVATFGYNFDCAQHDFKWTFPNNVELTGKNVSRQLPAGTHQVAVTISNAAQTYNPTPMSVPVGFTQPPPTTPNPPPPQGSCNPLNSSTVFISYNTASGSCSQTSGSCNTGELITLTVSAFGYNFSCSNHSFNWTIGGQAKSGHTITHSFATAGNYPVSVTVNNGTTSYTAQSSITVGGATQPPNPPPPSGCTDMTNANLFIQYYDGAGACNQSGGQCPPGQPINFSVATFGYNLGCDAHTFTWNFPGGVQKAGQNVQHTFPVNGTYNVGLTVKNGRQEFPARPVSVQVGSGIPQLPDVMVAIGKQFLGNLTYRFTPIISPVTATESIKSYVWTFGDGWSVTAPSADPVDHTYKSSCPDCIVTLTVYDASGQPLAPPTSEPLAPSRRRGAGH